jgi:hypothetical protein
LNILNQLRNRDVHRALLLAASYHRNARFLVSDGFTGQPLAAVDLKDTVYLAEGAQTIGLPVRASDVPALTNVKAMSTIGVNFLAEGPWGERSVHEILDTCMEHVEHRVIARFKPFFEAPPL